MVCSSSCESKSRIDTFDDEGNKVKKVVNLPGRLRLAQYLPDSSKIPFETINKLMTKRKYRM